MLIIDNLDIPGEFEVLEGISMSTFVIKSTEAWVKKHLTELGLSDTLHFFSYSTGDLVLESTRARITSLSSKRFYVEFMEGE